MFRHRVPCFEGSSDRLAGIPGRRRVRPAGGARQALSRLLPACALVVAFGVPGGLAAPVAASDIRAVTLSDGGIAMIEARGSLGPTPLRMTLRRRDIDDFLKSVWIADPAGAVPHLRMPGDGALSDTFDLLPFESQDIADPARLLSSLPGAELEVTRRGAVTTGRNLGVSARDCEEGRCQILTLLAADGSLSQYDLADSTVRLVEDGDRAMLDRALSAQRSRAAPGLIEVTLDSDDPTAREVDLVYLQEAPLWRTAYRAVVAPDGLRLSAWAVVENATGSDWDAVSLTLATGSVRSIRADLYERRYAGREVLAEPVMARPPAPQARGMAEVAPAFSLSADIAAAAVTADDGAGFSRFTLDVPVTLAAGDIVSLPFLDSHLPGAQRLVHRGDPDQRHPMIALDLTNPLSLRLPAGVLTLYEEGRGHAGDAPVPVLPPGASETIDVAADPAVSVAVEIGRSEQVSSLRISRGLLQIEEDLRRTTRYRIDGAAQGERVLDIEHPRRSGWTLASPSGAEELADAYRLRIALEEGAVEVIEVVETQPRRRTVALADLDAPALAGWLRQGALDAEARALLEALAAIRADQTGLARAIADSERQERDLVAEQDRLVRLIVALADDGPANRERRARVDAIDAEIALLQSDRRDLRARAAALEARLADLIAS